MLRRGGARDGRLRVHGRDVGRRGARRVHLRLPAQRRRQRAYLLAPLLGTVHSRAAGGGDGGGGPGGAGSVGQPDRGHLQGLRRQGRLRRSGRRGGWHALRLRQVRRPLQADQVDQEPLPPHGRKRHVLFRRLGGDGRRDVHWRGRRLRHQRRPRLDGRSVQQPPGRALRHRCARDGRLRLHGRDFRRQGARRVHLLLQAL
mmetsp:Transcript_35588/g.85188  ORF Transcript_35588/g.85188 Transcript_35588/m.85188 type:complete len:201 (+) Transcript_35588:590-1192(+)